MYDPFKRTRSKARKQGRKAASSALVGLVGAMFGSAGKPAKAPAKPRTVKNGPARKPAAPHKPAPPRARAPMPPGASFDSGVHVGEAGTLAFRLYRPAAARRADDPLPLLVMLHGCGQSPEDFARGTGMNALAEESGFLVVYPAQDRRKHVNRCWTWYRREDQGRGAGEPEAIAGLVRQVIAEQGADPARVYVAGLSAGASMALIVARAYPDIVAAVGVHSGLPAGAARDAATAAVAMRHGAPGHRPSSPMPTIVFHGDADTVVGPGNGRFVVSRALESYPDLRRTEKAGRSAGGAAYLRTSHRIGRGRSFAEHWVIRGGGHAWSGGDGAGRFTDPSGPDASREMVRFFLRHRTTAKRRADPG